MDVILSGNTTDAREVHPEKADCPKETLLPNVAEVRAVQPLNAYWPMDVSVDGKAREVMA